jgi:hypothetical protein
MIAKVFCGKPLLKFGNYPVLAILAILPALVQPDQIHPGVGMGFAHQGLGAILVVLGYPNAQP